MHDQKIPWLLKTYAGVLSDGKKIAEGDEGFLYHLFRGYERVFAQEPKRFDEMVRLQLACG
jgi:hypothetical protein